VGKSIVHCHDCGKAIREDDYLKGLASTIDSKNYCSTCRAVAPSSSRPLDLKKSSTSRMPLASGMTPRRGTAIASDKSQMQLIAGGSVAAVAVIAIIIFAFSGKKAPEPVEQAEAPKRAKPAVVKVVDDPKPAAELPPTQAKPAEVPVPKPVVEEKIPPPLPRVTDPLDGSSFAANAEIPIEAEARDPKGRIARVEFWHGPVKLGESSEVPYRFIWKGTRAAGIYELKAKSIDREGAEAASETVRITVKPEAEPAPATAETPAPAPAELAKAEPAPAGKAPEPKKEIVPQVDQKKVDAAIKKGVQYLVAQVGKMPLSFEKEPTRTCHSDELVLWTLIHAGVPESTAPFKFLFKNVTGGEFRRTYEVALQAMILEELDRVRYQDRILLCAQFLVDNQCANGQWNYGESPTKDVPTVYGALPVPTAGRPTTGPRQKPAVVKKLKVRQLRNGPKDGDNSNSQYAALGIRACADAGIVFPDELLVRARKWFRDAQHEVEGGAAGGVPTGTGISAAPRGWCYADKWHGHGGYGSMTAGAIGGMAIYDTLLGEDWRNDQAVMSGLSWLARNFSVSGNPGPPSEEWAKNDPKVFHYYYMYALERAGVLCKTEWIGRHAWYSEGANVLLAAQGRDGAWNDIHDTCFAILFLKRATRPLEDVASMDDRNRK
jgi:hypothetical protein